MVNNTINKGKSKKFNQGQSQGLGVDRFSPDKPLVKKLVKKIEQKFLDAHPTCNETGGEV